MKIMVVDDSPFSRTLLAATLEEIGCEVVGEADTLDSLLEEYQRCKPDIVTMDIAMPVNDGFECSKVLRMHDPEAKIVLVSSMKDEATEAEARKIGIAGYVQKPVDSEVLQRVLTRVLSPDTLFAQLENLSMDIFNEALSQCITRMTKMVATVVQEETTNEKYVSQGITVVIGIIGRYSGSLIVDLSLETAEKMVECMLRRKAKSHEEILALGAEFANVVGGAACSMLNKKEPAFGLRVAPPSVFYGAPTAVVSPNVRVRASYADADFGRIYLSVGFKKGLVLWM